MSVAATPGATVKTVAPMPMQFRAADLGGPGGRDGEHVAVLSAGAAGRRRSETLGAYYEVLSLDPAHVRLDRVNSGRVPICLDHTHLVRSVCGAATRAWFEGGKLLFAFRLETGSEDAASIQRKVDQKLITSVSPGYFVHRAIEIGTADDGLPIMLVVDWEPFEVSLVVVPFDNASVILRGAETLAPCEFETAVRSDAGATPTAPLTTGELSMTTPAAAEPNKAPVVDPALAPAPVVQPAPQPEVATRAAQPDATTAVEAAVRAEIQRGNEIRIEVRKAGLGEDLADRMIAERRTVDQVRGIVIDEISRANAARQITSTPRVQMGESHDSPVETRKAIIDGIAASITPNVKLEGKAVEFRGASPMECFEAYMLSMGQSVPYKKAEKVARAMSTSDFPVLLADVQNRVIAADYAAAAPTYREIAARTTFNDFRPNYVLRSGEFPALEEIGEGGEIRSKALSDMRQESMSLKTRGVKLAVTRELLVNDTLGELGNLIGKYGRRIAAQENALAYKALKDNRKLSDGKSAFHVDRKNIGSVSALPTIEALSEGRAALRKFKSDGIPLNFTAKIFLGGTDLETAAEKLMTSISAVATGEVNPFSGKLRIITDAALDDHDAWYLLCSPADAAILTYGYLNGATGPIVETKPGWDTTGIEYRVIHDFGVEITDWVAIKIPTK